MSNQLKMDKIEAIRNLAAQGWSQRRIARELGAHRSAVSRALKSEQAKEGDPKRATVTTGNQLGRQSMCDPYREAIEAKLELGLDAKRIHRDLRAEHAFEGSYNSVQRFVKSLKAAAPKRVWRMEVEPGEEAQVDYGTMTIIEGEGGRLKRAQLLRVTLSHSRRSYSEAMPSQDSESFIRALENAFRHFGGVPLRLCPDNLKAAVSKADWHDPEINPKLLSFARHYGVSIMPTRPYTPQHKGKVENGVGYIKRELKGRIFASVAKLNEHLLSWETNVADNRIHGTTRRQVLEHFLADEKPALKPLPDSLFPCYRESRRKVGRDGYVIVEKAYYDVPEQYIGRHLWVRWDARTVRILDSKLESVRVHARLPPGKFTQVLGADGRRGSFEESCGYYRSRCSRMGPNAAAWADGVVANRGEMAVRIMQGLLSLNGKYSKRQVDAACAKAALHGHYRLGELKGWLSSPQRQESFSFIERHEIIRSPGSYDSHIGGASLFGPGN
jgi:transposase